MIDLSLYLDKITDYCRSQDFRGFDPYDGLNSPLCRYFPFKHSKFSRQLWIQFFKNSPFNFRKLFLLNKGYNPKGLALFALGMFNLYGNSKDEKYLLGAKKLLILLESLSLKVYPGYCWGYNFPWQSRAFYAPLNTPNAICSVFCTEAIIKAYEELKEERYLNIARSSSDFFLKRLNISGEKDESCFSYTPLDRCRVHNVNLWVACCLSRINTYVKDKNLDDVSLRAVRFSVNRQNKDGSWFYGTADNQKWIDNFHTGFNLIALKKYVKLSGRKEFLPALEKGYSFFDRNLFSAQRVPKYYAHRLFPIDIHAVAVSIITYCLFGDFDPEARKKADRILSWAIENLWDKEGYFYFQKHRFYTIKIPYLRWSEAWMFYAMTYWLQ